MATIQHLISVSLKALHQINPENLTSENLSSSLEQLKDLDLLESINEFKKNLPKPSKNQEDREIVMAEIRKTLKPINHDVFKLNEELSRLKQLRTNLGLEALNPLITEAQYIVRGLFGFVGEFAE
ncbi:MAG: hypothetical protein K9I82_06010 [Chitinophagaceae bacterium]|nr:hypothetical protein [Chitinophagaceae bacterium]